MATLVNMVNEEWGSWPRLSRHIPIVYPPYHVPRELGHTHTRTRGRILECMARGTRSWSLIGHRSTPPL